MIIEPNGRRCSCGKNGCLERYLSFDALCHDLKLPVEEEETVATIEAMIKRNDKEIVDWLGSVAEHFRRLINFLEMSLDPDTIIVGGTAPARLLERLIETSIPFYPPLVSGKSDTQRVQLGSAGKNAVATGAAAASIDTHFAPAMSKLLL